MSVDQHKTLIRRFLDEVIGAGNLTVADELCAADLTWHGAGVADIGDLATYQGLLRGFFTAFPDRAVTIEDLVAEGDKVVARYAWRSAQQGEFQGLPPTGKAVTVSGMDIFRIADAKIAEQWWQEDLLGLMRQLGIVPTLG
jgi:steroid delta-isomerase-like uncharacterized protein